MSNEQLEQIQQLEQSLQAHQAQLQSFQSQLLEVQNAIEELGQSPASYKLIGNIMVARKPAELRDELQSKEEGLKMRVDALEKQQQRMKERITKLQQEIMQTLKKE